MTLGPGQPGPRSRLISARTLGQAFAIVSGVVAALVLLLGWGVGITLFQRISPDFAAMAPVTAACILFLSAVLYATHRFGARARAVVMLASGGTFGIAVLNALRLATNSPDPAPDNVFMSVNSTAVVLLLSMGAITSYFRAPAAARARTLLATLGSGLSYIVVTGYILDAHALFDASLLAGTSLLTALSLFFLTASLLLVGAEQNWTGAFFQPTPGSRDGLLSLPVALAFPVFAIWLAQRPLTGEVLHESLILPSVALAVTGLLLAIAVLITRARNRIAAETRAILTYLNGVLDGLDVAALVYDSNGTPFGANDKAQALCSPFATPFDWLEQAQFYHPVTRTPLPRSPKAELLDLQLSTEMHVALHEDNAGETYLRLSCDRPGAGEAGLTVISITDETAIWALRSDQIEQERQESISVMAGGIAHELGNFMGVIRLATDAGRLADPSPRQTDVLDMIGDACDRGTRLSEKLLQMTHSDLGTPEPVEVGDVLERVGRMADVDLGQAEVSVTVERPDGPLWSFADLAELEAALVNLILNARNALGEDNRDAADARAPEIVIRAYASPDATVTIDVTDTGPGMNEATRIAATTPFFTTRTAKGGTGLGLMMVSNFAMASFGQFDLISAPGAGTTARLILPQIPPPNAGEAVTTGGLAGLDILIVESDEVLGTLLPQALGLMGARATLAQDTATAQARLRAEADDGVDLVIASSDLIAPVWEEWEQAYPGKKWIVLTEARTGAKDYSGASVIALGRPVALRSIIKTVSVLSSSGSPAPT